MDIRHELSEVDARLMIYKRKEYPTHDGKETVKNQLWEVELSDPPRAVDSDDEVNNNKNNNFIRFKTER